MVETLQIAKAYDERGRRMADAPEKEALMAGYGASGMTQRAFALRGGDQSVHVCGLAAPEAPGGGRGEADVER